MKENVKHLWLQLLRRRRRCRNESVVRLRGRWRELPFTDSRRGNHQRQLHRCSLGHRTKFWRKNRTFSSQLLSGCLGSMYLEFP